MNRRLVIRCGVACLALCLAAWKLPPVLDRAFASIDQHRGAVSMLSAEGLSLPRAGADGLEVFAASGATLTPEERSRLLDAARRQDPLGRLKAQERASEGSTPERANRAQSAPGAPGVSGVSGVSGAPAGSLEDALRGLGLDPAMLDPASLDVESLLKKARDGASGAKPKQR